MLRCQHCSFPQSTLSGWGACENCDELMHAGKLIILPVIRIERFGEPEPSAGPGATIFLHPNVPVVRCGGT